MRRGVRITTVLLAVWISSHAQNPVLRSTSASAYVALNAASNLADLGNAAAARGNLGVSAATLVGTSGTVSGALTIGACNTATVAVTGSTTSMVASTSPVSNPDSGATGLVRWDAYVSSANVVTVRECGLGVVTPNATAYNVRVQP